MPTQPQVVVFDVNETLSDLTPLQDRFADVGAARHLAPLWFASLLRDGFALTAAGAPQRFAVVGREVLRAILSGEALDRDLDAAVEHVMEGFQSLEVHPDVPDGVRALRAAGLRLVTLSNGAAEVAEGLLSRAGLRDAFDAVLSVEDAGAWKPQAAAYEYAARTCRTEPGAMLLVAVHPWDIDGAARAGLRTAWLDRRSRPYPSCFTAPQTTVADLPALAARLHG